MSEQPSPPPAPGEATSIALALVNTEIEPNGQTVDLLPDGRTLATWLRGRQLITDGPGAIVDEDVERMRGLRVAIRAAFSARAEGRRPPRGMVAQINDAAALVASMPRLAWSADGFTRQTVWAQPARPADTAFAAIAADAITTLLGDRGDRLRVCEAHGCNRMFIADHRRRRWCSRTCGDRVRVARHYRKRHQLR